MIFLKNGTITTYIMLYSTLFSIPFTTHALSYESAQDYLNQALNTLQEHQTPIFIAGAGATTAAYLAYAIYLDSVINDKDNLWHWSMHHIKDGIIDQVSLMEYIEEHHPDLKLLHPLTAIFATAHAAQMEIELCLTLRSVLNSLKTVHLEWIISETITSLDKKLESLYILKIMLSHYTIETRTRCKKRARL